MIVDEVQTGFGRTGKFFACDHYGLEPDILVMAKAMAGGLPMGAFAISERVGQIPKGLHSSTFGGNPLACAVAATVIDILQEQRLPDHAAQTGRYFADSLRALKAPQVRDVRGLGLMIGMELKEKVAPHLRALMARGVLALAAGATVLALFAAPDDQPGRGGSRGNASRRRSRRWEGTQTMRRTRVVEALNSAQARDALLVKGWVRTRRDAKGLSFLELNDGSCLRESAGHR